MASNPELKHTHLHKALPDFEGTATVRPTRVLLISATGEMGGAERSLYEVARLLPSDALELHACVSPGTPLGRLLGAAHVDVHEVALRRFRRSTHLAALAGNVRALYQASRQVSDICKSGGIDLLHANTNSAALVAWEVGRMTKLPFI